MSDASLTPSTEDSEGSEPTLRRMVDRAVAELRRGDAVMMRPDRGPALLIHAADHDLDRRVARIHQQGGPPF